MKARRGAIQLELSDFSIYLLQFDDTPNSRETFLNFFAQSSHCPTTKWAYESLDSLQIQKGFRLKLKF